MAKVWAKYDTEFFPQMADSELSDSARLTHAEIIAYLYRLNRDDPTDFVLTERAIRRNATTTGDAGEAIKELVSSGYWSRCAGGLRIEHHADVIEESFRKQRNYRDRNVRSQRAKRAREKEASRSVSADEGGDVSGDVSAGATQAPKQPNKHRDEEVLEEDDRASPYNPNDPWTDAPVSPPGMDVWRRSGEPVVRPRTA